MAVGAEAALEAVRGRFETRDKEFAESQPFEVLKWKIVKSAMAMSNLRDGGSIIVGMSQRDKHFDAVGISDANLTTFDPDNVISTVNKYAKPPVEMAVYPVEEGARKFLVIDAFPFKRTPVMCSKSPPDSSGEKFKPGDIFARTIGSISTTRIADLPLMEEMLESAAEKRAAEIIATAQRIGLRMPASDQDAFAQERSNFGDMGDSA